MLSIPEKRNIKYKMIKYSSTGREGFKGIRCAVFYKKKTYNLR